MKLTGLLVTALMLVCFSVTFAEAELKEDDWQPLENELSRQDLFKMTYEPSNEFDVKAIPNKFVFPQDTVYDSIEQRERTNVIFGIDISHHTNSSLRFDLLREQNVHFVYMKATQGTGFKDPRFAPVWKALKALPEGRKVYRGAYHFLSASAAQDPIEQADRFVDYVNLHGGFGPYDMPPVMDLEWDKASSTAPDRWKERTPREIVNTALAWLNRVRERTGRTPMLYTARSWWRERRIPEAEFAKFSEFFIWIADYSKSARAIESPAVPNNAPIDLWQFSESSRLSYGYERGLDANIFRGTEEEFYLRFISGR